MTKASHNNNFNFLRLLFASLVVFSHSYALLGYEEPTLWGRSLGNLSVHGFFVISGYLICQSYICNPSLPSFFLNRFLRIIPGLVVALFFTKYVSIYCDGFKINIVPFIANGPVWTLTWEVVCYGLLAIFGQLGVLKPIGFPSFFAAAWLVYFVNISSTSEAYLVIAPLAMMFLAGAFIFIVEDNGVSNSPAKNPAATKSINHSSDFMVASDRKISKIPVVSFFALVAIIDFGYFQLVYQGVLARIPFLWGPSVSPEQILRVIYMAAFPFVIIYIGKHAKPIAKISNDISYGVYIYGWPVAQIFVYFAVANQYVLSPVLYFCLTMLVTIPLAFISWKVIEKPALALKKFSMYRI